MLEILRAQHNVKVLEGSVGGVNLAELFEFDYKKAIVEKAAQLGIKDELTILDVPLDHPGSKAIYPVEQVVGQDLILVSVLKEGDESSEHRHTKSPMQGEEYHRISGTLVVETEREGSRETAELNEVIPTKYIPMDVWHRVRAKESHALTFIIMRGAALVPPNEVHERRNLRLS